ncbi:MAG: hypothetical protein DRJ35_06215 [Thermoprotei archaeon]|nr:MAG: hypothetical protein DRJ35_06215 [Thermoprotei archaeon]
MKTDRKVAIAACIALLIILLVNTPFTCSQTKLDNTTYMVFSKDIVFKLPAYNTTISFSENYRMTKFEWDQWNATMIYFYNLQMDGDEVPKFGVSVKNANLTIVDFFVDQRLHVTLQGPSGTTGKLVVWSPYEPTAVHIVGREGQPPWDYKPSGGGYLIWVEVEFHSKATVIIDFTTTYYPYEPEPEEEIEIPWTTIAAGILIAGIFLTITALIVVTSGTRRRVR